jgi:hypothetical protein
MLIECSSRDSFLPGGSVNCTANAGVRPAPAEDAAHSVIDILVRGMRLLGDQSRGCHDLSRLTIATLRHILFDPRFLKWMTQVVGEAFDGGDGFSIARFNRRNARADCFSVDVDSAGAALSYPAPKFSSGEAERVSQYPQERRFGGYLNGLFLAVYGKRYRGHSENPFLDNFELRISTLGIKDEPLTVRSLMEGRSFTISSATRYGQCRKRKGKRK